MIFYKDNLILLSLDTGTKTSLEDHPYYLLPGQAGPYKTGLSTRGEDFEKRLYGL